MSDFKDSVYMGENGNWYWWNSITHKPEGPYESFDEALEMYFQSLEEDPNFRL